MSVDHYENFPVASILLPRRLRYPVTVIYRFARTADDIADEGDATPQERLAGLEFWRGELRRIAANTPRETPLGEELAAVVGEHALPLQLFHDLLDAFAQDVVKTRYADFPEVIDYCRRSANPVGRLLLHLYQRATPANLVYSDSICTALQLINFWQDVAVDWQKDRIYLPQEEMRRFGITEAGIAAGDTSGLWQPFLQAQVERARRLLWAGAPLAWGGLPGRLGLELRLVMRGGDTILNKIQAVQCDVFRRRPVLGPIDWVRMAGGTLRPRSLT